MTSNVARVSGACVLVWALSAAVPASAQYYPAPHPSPSGGPYAGGPYAGGPYAGGAYPDRGGRYGPPRFAWQSGYQEGYEEGFKAARRARRYDPVRERDYRRAMEGYRREFGPPEHYRRMFRDGFRAGYDDGYRQGRYASRQQGWPGWYGRPW